MYKSNNYAQDGSVAATGNFFCSDDPKKLKLYKI